MLVGNLSGQIRFSDPNFPIVSDTARFYIATTPSPETYRRNALLAEPFRLTSFLFGRESSSYIPYSDIRDNTFTREINLPEILDGELVITPVTLFCNVVDAE